MSKLIKRSVPKVTKFQARSSDRWNLWKDGISSSLLALWLSCREQFRQEAIEGWRSHYTPLALAFGTCMHWCLEQAYSERKAPNEAGCRKLVKAFEKLWQKERPNAPTKQLEVQEMAYGLAEAVLPSYFKRWAGDFAGGKYPITSPKAKPEKWIGLETQFEVPYTFADGKTVKIRGTRDGLFETPKKMRRVFDTKCRSMISEEDIEDTLPFDLQQMLYLWATWEEQGKPPHGTTMNIIRRPGHRRNQVESLGSFFRRVAKEVALPRKWGHYFIRVEMDVTEKEMLMWKWNVLDPIMADLRAWYEGKAPHYMNPNALVSKYGRCAMFNPIVFGNFSGCYRRDKGKIMSYQTDVA